MYSKLPFHRVTADEYFESLDIEKKRSGEESGMIESSSRRVKVRTVGRPKVIKELCLRDGTGDQIEVDTEVVNMRRCYINWLQPRYWPEIHQSLKRNQFHVRAAVRELQRQFPPNAQKVLDNWALIENSDEVVSDGEQENGAAGTEDLPTSLWSLGRKSRGNIWTGRKELESEYKQLLEKLRKEGSVLNSVTLMLTTKAFLHSKAPSLLRENGGTFDVSRTWVRDYVRSSMQWSFRSSTTAAQTLSSDWEEKGKLMALRMAYLIKSFNIPHELVINFDQTGLQLVPVGREKTYTMKGSREVAVTGKDDKRQVTLVPAMTATGELLPFQIIFTGRSSRSLPTGQWANILKWHGWHLTFTDNHWASLATCQHWVQKILKPWYDKCCYRLNRAEGRQRMLLLLDAWSVHRSEYFRSWMQREFPFIHLVYVPAGCTAKLQPCDVILQRPLKAGFQREYAAWAVKSLTQQMSMGEMPRDDRSDLSIHLLRNNACEFLWKVHKQLSENREMLMRGWGEKGAHLLRAFIPEFQSEALCANAMGGLFSGSPGDTLLEEEPDVNSTAQQWDGDFSPAELMEQTLGHRVLDTDLNDQAESEQMESAIPDFTQNPAEVESRVDFTKYLTDASVMTPYSK
ncbi:hypothetical protein R1sor_020703 [Riccia sorocarpa]|uniref:DDE-1 domain-containing protein n=1 Tax=Riccia sorocarpa TaxID=122646 RepID=A0ABD3GEX8_9MARC